MKFTETEKDTLFNDLNYRSFLRFVLAKRLEEGHSYRAIARDSGIKSPNFLQQVEQGLRDLTPISAEKVAKGLGLKAHEAEYFVQIVRLGHPKIRNKEVVLQKLKELQNQFSRTAVRDISIHSHWVNSVIFELCKIKGLRITPDAVTQLVGGLASKDDVAAGIDLLLKKEWIKKTGDDLYEQNGVEFQFLDGARRIDVQRSHLHYLKLAQHRINDDLKDRSFRGLTVAIPAAKFEWVKEYMRTVFDEIDKTCEAYKDPDSIIRIQLASYFVVRPEQLQTAASSSRTTADEEET